MITGSRVTLRAIRSEDYPRLTTFANDVEYELLGGGDPPRPRTLAMVTEFYDNLVKEKSGVTFAIEADGLFIGHCGLFNVNQRSGTAEIGIGIGDRAYWSKGYGREALTLLADFGFRMHNLRKLWLETSGSNERAIRSYRAVGFVEEGRQREHAWSGGRYQDLVLMGLFRAEFEQARASMEGAHADRSE
jgi:RimJ/RimL family protein N-acetyltransferase